MSKKKLAIVLGLIVVVVLVVVSLGSSAVTYPVVKTRFSNPVYNPVTKKWTMDVEFQSGPNDPSVRLFGGNFRMFYDAVKFLPGNANNFKLTGFAPGYGAIIPNPPNFGTGNAGIGWFKFPTNPITYVNGAFQLTNPSAPPIYLTNTTWTKLFSVEATSATTLSGQQCPPFVLDKKINGVSGFMPNAEGLTYAYVISPTQNGYVTEYADHFNWAPYTTGTPPAPWGEPNQNNCVQL